LKEDSRAEVIDGHRRLAAVRKLLKMYAKAADAASQAKAARFQELVCLVEEIPPSVKKHLELQMLLNAVRKNFSPVEQARYLRKIKELEPAMTQEELGACLPEGGKSQGYVSRLLMLAQDETLLRQVEKGELTAADAYHRGVKGQEKAEKTAGDGAARDRSKGGGKKSKRTTTPPKSEDQIADEVLLTWREKVTSVQVVLTGAAAHKANLLYVARAL